MLTKNNRIHELNVSKNGSIKFKFDSHAGAQMLDRKHDWCIIRCKAKFEAFLYIDVSKENDSKTLQLEI